MRFEPKRAGRNGRSYSYPPPPFGFVAAAMHLAMMSSTQGDSEFIADLAAERGPVRGLRSIEATGRGKGI
jgi:hypothetical protein